MTEQGATFSDGGAERPRREAVTPPYVSFNTFRTLIDWLRSEGVPLRYDRSFWQAKFSGSTGTQLVAALRFLGLLEGDGPTPDLDRMANAAPDERRLILRELLKDSYDSVPFEELDRATPAMVKGWFRAYPVDGHTLRKAVSFFVNATKYAGVPISNAVSKMAKSRVAGPAGGGTRDKQVTERAIVDVDSAGPRRTPRGERAAPGRSGAQPSRITIGLESGGGVTVDVAVDLFQLSDRDREFVLRLVDLTRSYEGRQGKPEAGTEDTPGD